MCIWFCVLLTLCSELIHQFSERLVVLSEEVRACAKRPGDPLSRSVSILIEATLKYIQGTLPFIVLGMMEQEFYYRIT